MKNEKLNKKNTNTFYSYIGKSHIENIAIDIKKDLDLSMEDMDEWFCGYINSYEKTLKSENKKRKVIKLFKIAAVIIGIFSISFTGLFVGVDAFRATVLNNLFADHEMYTVVGNSNYDDLIELGVIVPNDLPIDFSLVTYEKVGKMYKTIYQNNKGYFINIMQVDLETYIQLDTEKAYSEIVELDGREILIIEKDKIISCYWESSKNSFGLISNLSKKEVLFIINSMD